MRFSDSFLDEIRARLPLSQVVGRHVQWDRRRSQPARGDMWACCPFHHEKTPSFHVDDRKGFYYCFGCHAKGDHFRFLMEKEGLDFAEAVQQLAAEAGLQLPAADPHQQQRHRQQLGLLEVLEAAARFYERQLHEPAGAAARAYAERRGLLADTIARFRLGAAPDARDALCRHLRTCGVSEELMVRAGLVVRPEDGGRPYDRLRHRLVFPIRDVKGRVVAFGGRALGEARAKYLNSPETDVFHKSRLLYNLDQARQPAFEHDTIIVVEGYMDVIALHQAGFPHAVAPLGTALTEAQLALLWRVCAQPLLCFDGDAAGLKAAWRALNTALPHLRPGHSLRFAFLPEGMDPDDLLRLRGPQAFATVLEEAEPLIDFLFRHLATQRPRTTPEERAALEAELEEMAARIGDAKVRQHYRLELRERLRQLFGHRPPLRPRHAPRRHGHATTAAPPPSARLKSRAAGTDTLGPLPEQDLLRMLLLRPDIVHDVAEAVAGFSFSTQALDSLAKAILDIVSVHDAPDSPQRLDSTQLLDHLQGGPHGRAAALLMRQETPRRLARFARCPAEEAAGIFLQRLEEMRRVRQLRAELELARQAFDSAPTEENLARLQQLRAELDASREASEQ